jgi:Acetyltransferase (GNAT) domain
MDYRIYNPAEDEASVLDLRAKVWGDDHPHNDSEFLDWMLLATPLGNGTGILMSKDGLTVGFMGISPRLIAYDGKEYLAGHCMDLMVHPQFRSTLSSLKLVNQCLEALKVLGYDYAYGFPNKNSFKLVTSPKCGYQPVFSPNLSIRPIGNGFVSKQLVPWLPEVLGKMAGQSLTALCTAWAFLGQAKLPPGECCTIDTFDSRFDEFWHKAQSTSAIGLKQGMAYLNWRFVGHPIYSYRKFAWVHNGEVKGYIVTSNRDLFGVPTALLVDIMTLDNNFNVFNALLNIALAKAREDGCQLVATQSLASSKHFKFLTLLGFIPVPQKFNPKQFNFVLHGLGRDLACLGDGNKWSFNWCDMDIV